MSQVYVGNGSGGGGPTTDLHVARYIVSAGGTTDGANYTTIASAYAAAVAAGGNQTVFIQPGTYTENLTLTAGINLTAFDCDAQTPNVTINGKMTANITGTCSFSGINFLNNSDNILSVSGSGACNFKFVECFINVSGTAFAFANSNSSCGLDLFSCNGDISGTSSYFNFTAGGVNIQDCFLFNDIESTTQSVFSGASIDVESSTLDVPINATGTGGDVSIKHSTMIVLNATVITTSGGPNSDLIILNSHIDSNNATAISIGSGSTMTICNTTVGSNTNPAITGAGVLLYSPIAFTKSSAVVNVSTQTPLRFGPQISPELANTNGTVYYDGTIIATISPGSSGQVLTSNGAGSPPSYQTGLATPVTVPNGGTGDTSFTAYSVICGGTTSTGNLQNVSGVGTSGQVLTSNGAGALPTWQAGAGGSTIAFRAHLNANTATNITGDGTFVTVPFDTVDYDIGSGYNTGTNIYTVPAAEGGIYQINYTVFTYRVAGANTVELLNFVINGVTTVRNYELDFETAQTSGELTLTSGAQYQLSAGDTVNITCAVGGAAKNIGFAGTYCVFSMCKIG